MKYIIGFITGLVVFSVVQFSQASKEGEKVKTKASETVDASKEYASTKKKEFETKLKTELADLNQNIDELKVKAQSSGKEAKAGFQEQIDGLEKKRKDVAAKLDKLTKSSGKAWDRMKEGVEAAWTDLKSAYSKASDSFNE